MKKKLSIIVFGIIILNFFLNIKTYSQDTKNAKTEIIYSQGFNSTSVPSDWIIQNLSGNSTITFVTQSSHPSGFNAPEGSHFSCFNSYSSNNGSQSALQMLSDICLSGYADIELSFYWLKQKTYTGNDRVALQYSIDAVYWTELIELNNQGAEDEWLMVTVPAPNLTNLPLVYFRLLFTSGYGADCYLDDFSISATQLDDDIENKGLQYDVLSEGVNSLLCEYFNYNSPQGFTPSIEVFNNSELFYSNTSSQLTLPAMSTMIVTFPETYFPAGSYNVITYTGNPNDQNTANDIVEQEIKVVFPQHAYLWKNSSNKYFSKILIPDGFIQNIAPVQAELIQGCDFVDDKLYVCEQSGSFSKIYVADTISGTHTLIGNTNTFLNCITYDRITKRLYGVEFVNNTSYLCEIDKTNAQISRIGEMLPESNFDGLASIGNGSLIGLNLTNSTLYRIDINSGIASSIGHTVYTIEGFCDLAFDQNNKVLYGIVLCTTQDFLCTFDTITGRAKNLKQLGTNTGYDALAIPYKTKFDLDVEFSDFSTNSSIQDVVVKLFDNNGNVVGEGISNENGLVTFNAINIGEYYVQAAANGYYTLTNYKVVILDNDVFKEIELIDVTYQKIYGANSFSTGYVLPIATDDFYPLNSSYPNQIFAGTWCIDTWFAVDSEKNFVRIDKNSGVVSLIGATGITDYIVNGMAYDRVNDVIYASALDQISPIVSVKLYTINKSTGLATYKTTLSQTGFLLDIAIDNDGILYGICQITDDNAVLWTINKENGTVSVIGNNVGVVAPLLQSFEYDFDNNKLVFVTCNISYEMSGMYYIDPFTSNSSFFTSISNKQVLALAIPYIEEHEVQFIVKDSYTQAPIQNAVVKLKNEFDVVFFQQNTNSQGTVVCDNIINGMYFYSVEKQGYELIPYSMFTINNSNDVYNLFMNLSLGLNKIDNTFVIYPNPTCNTIMISNFSKIFPLDDEITIQIFDIYGRNVLESSQIKQSEIILNVGFLNQGVYWVKLTAGNEYYCAKFMKQ